MRYPRLLIKACITCLITVSTEYLFAQLPVYNSDFRLSPSIQTKGELGDSLRIMGIVDRTYEIGRVKVIEYYEMNTGRFLGFAGDTTQFDLRKLPYLNRSPMMRRLLSQFGPVLAHDIRQGKFAPGILQKDILEMHGWPTKRKREGKKVVWIYEDVILVFENRELTQFTRQGS